MLLEIGSYYGVLGSVLKDKVKNYSGLELSIMVQIMQKKI